MNICGGTNIITLLDIVREPETKITCLVSFIYFIIFFNYFLKLNKYNLYF
jgi:hypothetical protein